MAELQIVTLTAADAALGETVVERFGGGLRGELLRPGHTAYDEARKVWNGLIDKHPALIARCAWGGGAAGAGRRTARARQGRRRSPRPTG